MNTCAILYFSIKRLPDLKNSPQSPSTHAHRSGASSTPKVVSVAKSKVLQRKER